MLRGLHFILFEKTNAPCINTAAQANPNVFEYLTLFCLHNTYAVAIRIEHATHT